MTKIPVDIEQRLTDKDYKVRADAIRDLGNSKTLDAIPYLLAQMEDEAVTVRAKVTQALKKFYNKDPRVLPALIVLAADVHGVHKWVYNFLTEKGPAIAPAANDMLSDSRANVRITCLTLLAYVKPDALPPRIPEMLNDPDPEVRQIAEGIANICASFGPNTGYAPILQEAIDAAKAKNNE